MTDTPAQSAPELMTLSLLAEVTPWGIANAATRQTETAAALLAELAFMACEVTVYDEGALEAAILAATKGRGLEEQRLRALAKLSARLAHAAALGGLTPSGEESAKVYAKLDDDSLDAIVEVVGSPALYNQGKSQMRAWFLGRLRRLWGVPEPVCTPAAAEG